MGSTGSGTPSRDVFKQAASALWRICAYHPFVDGNKRTGLATALRILNATGLPAGRRPHVRDGDRRGERGPVQGGRGRKDEGNRGPARSFRHLKTEGHWDTMSSIGVSESASTQPSGSLRPSVSLMGIGCTDGFITLSRPRPGIGALQEIFLGQIPEKA